MTEPERWTVRLCELGGDLRPDRCHAKVYCRVFGVGCNIDDHYCRCEPFEVVRHATTHEYGEIPEVLALREWLAADDAAEIDFTTETEARLDKAIAEARRLVGPSEPTLTEAA